MSYPTRRRGGGGARPHLLVGALAHSGRWRAVLCESEDQAHLIEGLDRVTRALGGVSRDWRFDRMATVISPGTGRPVPAYELFSRSEIDVISVGLPHHQGVARRR